LEEIRAELWISLASLLRSYTAVHGMSGNRQAAVELDEGRILARCDGNWMDLRRTGARVSRQCEDGRSGVLELTETGRLRSESGEEEMDMAAERWARDLMRELQR
jgi:lipocalin